MSSFTLALIQMRVDGGDKQGNLRRAEGRLAEAASKGAAVAVLPEALTLGWTHPSAQTDADAIPDGESCQRLRAAAERHRMYVCAGLIERAGDRIFNSAVLIDPRGEVVLHHRKLNELEIGHDLYAQGDRLGVAQTPLGTFGLMICADAFACGQVVARTLGYMGADVILSPSAWAVPAEHDEAREPYGRIWIENYCPVARDFRMWIAGVSNVGAITAGPWQGRKCIGCSLLIDPSGKTVVRGPYGENADAVLYAEITAVKRPARGCAWATLWNEASGRPTYANKSAAESPQASARPPS